VRVLSVDRRKEEAVSEASARTRDELEAQIVARARSDETFRERLKADPRAAVADVTGVVVPESIQIEVLEETPEQAYLVIPLNRIAIAEDQLDAVSGGAESCTGWTTGACGGPY
jgi:Nitrile hydratase, alpha chain